MVVSPTNIDLIEFEFGNINDENMWLLNNFVTVLHTLLGPHMILW